MAVSSTRREALRLYRDLLKACKKFNWSNDDGLPWYELNFHFLPIFFCSLRNTHENDLLTIVYNSKYRSKVLKESVQKEFRQSKYEMEPEMILRMIFTGREALRRTEEALELKRLKLMGFQGETLDDAVNMSEKISQDDFTFKRS